MAPSPKLQPITGVDQSSVAFAFMAAAWPVVPADGTLVALNDGAVASYTAPASFGLTSTGLVSTHTAAAFPVGVTATSGPVPPWPEGVSVAIGLKAPAAVLTTARVKGVPPPSQTSTVVPASESMSRS